MAQMFTQSQLESISDALGDTSAGLTGSEMAHLLASCQMKDPTPTMTKRHRLYNAFVESQNARRDRQAILAFIRKSMKPERFAQDPERFEPMRANLNVTLSFAGLCVTSAGKLVASEKASTLTEAQRRAQELREDLLGRGTHPFCAFAGKNCSLTIIFTRFSKLSKASLRK